MTEVLKICRHYHVLFNREDTADFWKTFIAFFKREPMKRQELSQLVEEESDQQRQVSETRIILDQCIALIDSGRKTIVDLSQADGTLELSELVIMRRDPEALTFILLVLQIPAGVHRFDFAKYLRATSTI